MTTMRPTESSPPGAYIIGVFSRLVPADRRAEWVREWRSELVNAFAEAEEAGESARVTGWRLRMRGLASIRDAVSVLALNRRSSGGPVLRDAVRAFRHRPGFLIAVVVTLGLGMGAATAIFSVVDALLLNPLPFAEPDRIVVIDDGRSVVSETLLDELHREERIFRAVGGHMPRTVTLTGEGEPRSMGVRAVQPGFLAMLGLRPRLGRGIEAADAVPGRDRVIVLGDEIWRGVFDADPGVIGRTVQLSAEPYTVIGVLPPTLRFLPAGLVHGLVPLTTPLPAEVPVAMVLARLQDGVSLRSAQSRLQEIGEVLNRDRPREGGWNPHVTRLQARNFSNERAAMVSLSGAALFLLLIACANAAGLLFVRGASREAELSVRRALGATRWTLFRQLLAESAVMAVLAGALGTWIAWWGVRGLLAIAPETLVRWHYSEVTVSPRVFGFALALTVLTGLTFGMAPAVWAARRSEAGGSTDRGATLSRAQMRVRRGVQVVQIALAVVLLCSAGLLGHSFVRLAAVDPGFDADHILEVTFSRSPRMTTESRVEFNRQLDAALRRLPGVVGVGWSSGTGINYTDALQAEGSEPLAGPSRTVVTRSVDTAFFRVVGIRLQEGRGFIAADLVPESESVIIDRDLATLLWPGRSALGGRLRTDTDGRWSTVVGVASDAKLDGPDDRDQPWAIYSPTTLERVRYYSSVRVRAHGSAASIATAVRQAVRSLDPDLPIYDLRTARQAMAEERAAPRFVLVVMGVFASLALLLASVGVYGLVAFTVARRTREIGIRMAIGAREGQVVRSVFADGMTLALLGLLIGMAGFTVLSRFMRSLLFDITPGDPLTYVAAGVSIAVACLVALLMPARRAAATDPASALRAQ